jgi:uncharacterized phiE125 gp8 family phage protein
MIAVINTPPELYPVSLSELKTHLRIDAGTIDDEVSESNRLDMIRLAAIDAVEQMTARKLLTQTWDYYLNAWPSGDAIKLPFGRLQSVASVSYKDDDGDETTLTVNTDYLVETNGDAIGRLVLPDDTTWPSSTLYPSNPIKARFVCGWTAAASVPHQLRSAVLLMAEKIFYNGDVPDGFNDAVDTLTANYRLWDEF